MWEIKIIDLLGSVVDTDPYNFLGSVPGRSRIRIRKLLLLAQQNELEEKILQCMPYGWVLMGLLTRKI
jgi:hypothetical protein